MSKPGAKRASASGNSTSATATATTAAPKKNTREETERAVREEQEQQQLYEALKHQEREGEAKQLAENEQRDTREKLEEKARRKEAKLALIALKDDTITSLQGKLAILLRTASSDKEEYQAEMQRLLERNNQLADSLADHISRLETLRGQTEQERNAHEASQRHVQALLQKESEAHTICRTRLSLLEEQSDLQEQRLKAQCAMLENQNAQVQRTSQERVEQLERELQHSVGLNKTLQDVVDAREREDRRNVVLMNLLNTQLDENRQRNAELMEQAHQKYQEAMGQLAEATMRIQQLSEEVRVHLSEKEAFALAAEEEKKQYVANLESIRFDVKFLHSELHTYKSKLTKQAKDTQALEKAGEETVARLTHELQETQEQLHAAQEELRTRERDYYDKVTLMNAQACNARNTIQQLQQRLQKEMDARASENEASQAHIRSLRSQIEQVTAAFETLKKEASDANEKNFEDAADLKRTIYKLQSSLVSQERDLSNALYQREEEISKLREKLADHFVIRKDLTEKLTLAASDDGAPPPTIEAVQEEARRYAQTLQEDLNASRKLFDETETRLRAQVANQQAIIESLHLDVERTRLELGERILSLTRENDRMRRVLDTGSLRGTVTA